jgi:hypothetical protein
MARAWAVDSARGKLAARTFHLVFSGIGRVYLGEPVIPPRYPVRWANPPWRYDRLTSAQEQIAADHDLDGRRSESTLRKERTN